MHKDIKHILSLIKMKQKNLIFPFYVLNVFLHIFLRF